MRKVKLVEAEVVKLDPKGVYVIQFEPGAITKAELQTILEDLHELGVSNVIGLSVKKEEVQFVEVKD